MQIAIMIEGQEDINWTRWKRIVRAVEDFGFQGLFRSDHFTNPSPLNQDALELWISLAWLADNTSRIEFGPLVSPVSFRDPMLTARQAAAVDDLAGGRLVLGLGAGWMVREHEMFGYDLLDLGPRFDRFEEALEVITRLLNSNDPVSFEGEYYHLRDAILLPRPQRPGGPPILIGGTGRNRTLPFVARYAREWNAVSTNLDEFRELNPYLDELLRAQGRDPKSVKRSMMTSVYFGRTETELRRHLEPEGLSPDALNPKKHFFGTPDRIREQLAAWEAAELERVMLRWRLVDDIDGLEALAKALL
ncbi:MAG TPA: TIGR03560 family F420-dependent LLM class oxidoreductase [Aggregatilinea sp.]|uniref:TIGR03560 family F420-dependent LLM class oxidoreductase n=1 Tax=Aggregatilinea sp. TaxID=2806333 RepID=UPI002C947A60|nr:TIGR03560 family F420-dependent LLM class oxidoreductase [Aggregatilinea sp.]HML23350.1 TIGR03560 family F420-dependent LLM class oxidoreductase [Aggregatilinea sp.]